MVFTDVATAADAFRHALQLCEPLADDHSICTLAHCWLAVAAVQTGEQVEAITFCRNSLVESRRLQSVKSPRIALRAAALALDRAGRHRAAAQALGAADGTSHTGQSVQPVMAQVHKLLDGALGETKDEFIRQGAALPLNDAIDGTVTELTVALDKLEARR